MTKNFLSAKTVLSALALAGGLALASPAAAQAADPVVQQARAAGAVGEQEDGYLGVAPGQNVSADVRGRVNQVNMRRRTAYATQAEEAHVSANEMGASVACNVTFPRIAVGERYRRGPGDWRQRAPGASAQKPDFCPN